MSKQQIATENSNLYNDVAQPFNKILALDNVGESEIWSTLTDQLNGDSESATSGNAGVAKTTKADLDLQLAVYTQASALAPVLITPCLKRMAALNTLQLHDCPIISSSTLLLLCRNCTLLF